MKVDLALAHLISWNRDRPAFVAAGEPHLDVSTPPAQALDGLPAGRLASALVSAAALALVSATAAAAAVAA